MNPELNCEYPEPGEAKLIVEMVRLAVERMEPRQGKMRRAQHAKATGCVRGVFTIRDDVADDLRYGVFHEPNKAFQAIVRFSNSSEAIEPDGKGAARGMAIKLLDVEGTPAIPAVGGRCQDFLTINHPAFPFGTPAEYVKFFDIRARPRVIGELLAATWLALFHRRSRKIITGILRDVVLPATPVAGDALAAAWLALFHPRHARIASEILLEVVASPLMTYWSGSPYWLGPTGTTGGHAVKYSLVPCCVAMAPPSAPDGKPNDYLTQVLRRYLKTQEAVFEFRVQPQTDPVAMPVEDTSIEWDEAVSKPIPVATLSIGVQDLDSPAGRALAEECETLAFSPWNTLAEHRPMGGINRLRQAVYLASQANRAKKSVC